MARQAGQFGRNRLPPANLAGIWIALGRDTDSWCDPQIREKNSGSQFSRLRRLNCEKITELATLSSSAP
ncbi:hypothetical protein [Bradyrhizobium ivorense]|uniref:hypothetical protein n=1 Tax=Bradyrhizobium ivorense TaxID=2511166 RepID=UPI0011233468|nr:hypothetical protein [Bradyrhizobium ivorense]